MYQVYPANSDIEEFTNIYLNDEQFSEMLKILSAMLKIRPFWGNTKYRYIVINHIYFLYDVDETNNIVLILGVKFNNERKTFNFARTPVQVKTLTTWIDNKKSGKY